MCMDYVTYMHACTNVHCVECIFWFPFLKSFNCFFPVSGPLSSVVSLSTFINLSTVNISWSPPFTLPGTTITGYNISVTSNGTTTNYFTSDSYYVLQLSYSYCCNDTSVSVSGYNGLNGEIFTIYVWQPSGIL